MAAFGCAGSIKLNFFALSPQGPVDAGTGQDLSAIGRGQAQRLTVLDSVRGIAAMIVVVHHCLLTQPAFSDYFFSTWRTNASTLTEYLLFHTPIRIVWDGYEAVTLFYVLSGLVLMLPWVEGRPPDYLAFCVKRICRIYLPYCAAIAGAATLAVLLIHSANVPGASDWVNHMTWSNPITPGVLADHALMIGHYNTVNGVIHSLIWEMRVSLLFPILVLPLVRWKAKGAVGTCAILLAFVAMTQIGFAQPGRGVALLEFSPTLSMVGRALLEMQWTAYYACFFVLGATMAMYLGAIRRLLTDLPSVAQWAILLVGLLMFQAHWTRIHPLQETMVALGSALVIAAALSPGVIERGLMRPVLRFLGRISYSIYLVHVPLLLTAVLLLQGRVPMPLILLCVPPTAVAVGWLFQVTVTEPSAQLGAHLARRLRQYRQASAASKPLPNPVTVSRAHSEAMTLSGPNSAL